MPKLTPKLAAFESPRRFVQTLVLAELLARRGEGPLAPRFRPAARARVLPRSTQAVDSPASERSEKDDEP